jgi:HPt (histidine-containing phosphotransfer) domain-containing protein
MPLQYIDMTELLERVDQDQELVQEIFELYLQEAPGLMQRVAEAVAAQNADALAKTAHAYKGVCLNLSAHGVQQLAYELEQMGREQRLDGIDEAFQAFQVQISAMNQEVANWLATQSLSA